MKLSWCEAIYALLGIPLLGVICACGDSDRRQPSAPSIPASVEVPAATVEAGFSNGVLREQFSLAEFSISKHPITQLQLAACVASGACNGAASVCTKDAAAPYHGYDHPAYSDEHDDAPALCASIDQAEDFCAWVGGRLPTLSEWLLAARGPAIRRFSWGDEPSDCSQHPFAGQLIARAIESKSDEAGLSNEQNDPEGDSKGRNEEDVASSAANRRDTEHDPDCDDIDADSPAVIGMHKKGKSPTGLEDVLLTPGELIGSEAGSMFNACGENFRACVVFGAQPAAIDGVAPAYESDAQDSSTKLSSVAHAYGFRCAWEAK